MLRVLTKLVGPSLSAIIDGVSYLACLNVNGPVYGSFSIHYHRSPCQLREGIATLNTIRCPDFCMVVRRDYPLGPDVLYLVEAEEFPCCQAGVSC